MSVITRTSVQYVKRYDRISPHVSHKCFPKSRAMRKNGGRVWYVLMHPQMIYFSKQSDKTRVYKQVFICGIYNLSPPQPLPRERRDWQLGAFYVAHLWHLPKKGPKLRVIIVAKATNGVIFCNFPGGIAIDGGGHVWQTHCTTRKHPYTHRIERVEDKKRRRREILVHSVPAWNVVL